MLPLFKKGSLPKEFGLIVHPQSVAFFPMQLPRAHTFPSLL